MQTNVLDKDSSEWLKAHTKSNATHIIMEPGMLPNSYFEDVPELQHLLVKPK